jgi:hypothetical protein
MVMADSPTTDLTRQQRPVADYISIAAAVEASGYSDQYLRRLVRQKKIRGIKFGHFWMVDAGSLVAYLTEANAAEDRRFGPREIDGA